MCYGDYFREHFQGFSLQAVPYWWLFNIGLGNGLVPSSNMPLPEPMLVQIFVTISLH